MDRSLGRSQIQGQLGAKEDSGIKSVDLANKYLQASSDQDKKQIVTRLSYYLDKLMTDEQNNPFLENSIYDTNWMGAFNSWKVRPGDNGDEKIQEFKTHVYQSHYAIQGKDFICTELNKAANDLSQRADIPKLLPLLSKSLPHRANKIDVLINYLQNNRPSGQVLVQAIGEVCAETKSIGERAQSIAQDTALGLAAQQQQLQSLHQEAQSEEPKQPLLLLLWKQEIKDLDKVITDFLSRSVSSAMEQGTAENTQNVLKERSLSLLEDTLSHMPSIEPKESQPDVSRHFEKILKIMDRLAQFLKQHSTDQKALQLIDRCKKKLDDDADIIIEHLVNIDASDDLVVQYFNDVQLSRYVDKFWQKKFKNEQDYFKNFDTFLSNLAKENKTLEVIEYKKILSIRAIIAIGKSITSEPEKPQNNYFSESENLKVYWELQKKVNALNLTMYNAALRDKNIATLSSIQSELLGLMTQKEFITKYGIIVYSICEKIKFLRDFLTFQKNLEKLQKDFDGEKRFYEDVVDDMLIIALSNMRDGIKFANNTDQNQIKLLLVNRAFMDFFNNRFNGLTVQAQTKVIEACEKIYEKVHDNIPDFPIPCMQPEQAGIGVPVQQSIVQPQAGVLPVAQEQQDGGQLPVFVAPQKLSTVVQPVVVQQPGNPAIPVAQQPVGMQQPNVPVVDDNQQAQQGNEPAQQGFVAIISAVWDGLVTTLWAGLAWIRRMFF